MSVYIGGMKMPIDGNETIIKIQPDGTVLDQYGHHLAIIAIPVQKHGRLIDTDALCERLRGLAENEYTPKVFAAWIENHIDAIIPASKESDI